MIALPSFIRPNSIPNDLKFNYIIDTNSYNETKKYIYLRVSDTEFIDSSVIFVSIQLFKRKDLSSDLNLRKKFLEKTISFSEYNGITSSTKHIEIACLNHFDFSSLGIFSNLKSLRCAYGGSKIKKMEVITLPKTLKSLEVLQLFKNTYFDIVFSYRLELLKLLAIKIPCSTKIKIIQKDTFSNVKALSVNFWNQSCVSSVQTFFNNFNNLIALCIRLNKGYVNLNWLYTHRNLECLQLHGPIHLCFDERKSGKLDLTRFKKLKYLVLDCDNSFIDLSSLSNCKNLEHIVFTGDKELCLNYFQIFQSLDNVITYSGGFRKNWKFNHILSVIKNVKSVYTKYYVGNKRFVLNKNYDSGQVMPM